MNLINGPLQRYREHPQIEHINKWLNNPEAPLHIKGLAGSSTSLLISAAQATNPQLIITPDKESAAYMYHDLM
ncbi:MAG TPA: hypothetical protein DDW62_04260, partial [Marinilabiliaceae bacterium]|nr:hypothetical protein [Marinilabiliaceae bacterium]